MILTVATTPELFRTSRLLRPLSWSETNSLSDISVVPAGGGTNVANVLFCAGAETRVIVPAPEVSHYVRALSLNGLPYELVDVPGPIPVRYLIDAQGDQQLQFADPAMALKPSELAMLRDLCVAQAEDASWVVLAGVLPDIAHASWYVDIMRALRLYHPNVKVAVSTNGAALKAVIRQIYATKPDLILIDARDSTLPETSPDTVRTLIDADVSHVLVCHERRSFTLHSAGQTYQAHYGAPSGKQWLPWLDAALAGALLDNLDNTPDNALISALAWANAEIGDPLHAVPTPDMVKRELVASD